MNILANQLLNDNISEALREIENEGYESFGMLVCEVISKSGAKAQVIIKVTIDQFDFIDNTEEMPILKWDGEKLTEGNEPH